MSDHPNLLLRCPEGNEKAARRGNPGTGQTILRSARRKLLGSTLASRLFALPRPSKKDRHILERRMIFWSAELFVRAAGLTAVALLGATAASLPASHPARAQDGPVVHIGRATCREYGLEYW